LLSAYEQLAGLLADRLEDAPSAMSLLDEMVIRNKETSRAYVLHGMFLQTHIGNPLVQSKVLKNANLSNAERSREMLRRALEDSRVALKLAPADAEALIFAAQMAFMYGSFKEAKE